MISAFNMLKNKYYLYLTEFFAGMSVMAVELGASRLLAPYFRSSQIVWTIIIGTIMIAMALGNIWGGRSADKNPNPDRLYIRIIIAAIWIAAIPVLGKYIIIGISALLVFTISSNFLIWAAFLACMIIFVFPLFLLGTVTPSLVKYTVDSLDESGKTVGALGACAYLFYQCENKKEAMRGRCYFIFNLLCDRRIGQFRILGDESVI